MCHLIYFINHIPPHFLGYYKKPNKIKIPPEVNTNQYHRQHKNYSVCLCILSGNITQDDDYTRMCVDWIYKNQQKKLYGRKIQNSFFTLVKQHPNWKFFCWDYVERVTKLLYCRPSTGNSRPRDFPSLLLFFFVALQIANCIDKTERIQFFTIEYEW